MSFYVHLPSNGSTSYFPSNSTSSFSTKLPETLRLDLQSYTCALVDFSYVNSFDIFQSIEDYKITVTVEDYSVVQHIEKKRFADVVDLMNSANEVLSQAADGFVGPDDIRSELSHPGFLQQDINTKKMSINVTTNCKIVLSKCISQALGFTSFNSFGIGETEAESAPMFNLGMHHIYIYCDIVKPQIVSNSLVPLLRVCDVKGKFGEVQTEYFRPYYLPLSRTSIDTIDILICNEFGETVRLHDGPTTVTLHFRRNTLSGQT